MQKPLTEKRLENIALFYLERFETSSEKLRQVLKRRAKRQKMQGIEVDPAVDQWIESVIQKVQNQGFVDDTRYAQNAVRRMSEQGKSVRFIRQKLKVEGVDSEVINDLVRDVDDVASARIFVRKRHLSACEKDLAKLAGAGFDYETAKKVLFEQGEEDA